MTSCSMRSCPPPMAGRSIMIIRLSRPPPKHRCNSRLQRKTHLEPSARTGCTSVARSEAVVVRALLLDFDGTLADSLSAMRRVYERFVTDLGGAPSNREFDAFN